MIIISIITTKLIIIVIITIMIITTSFIIIIVRRARGPGSRSCQRLKGGRRENMVGVDMVHDAICECFEGTMLEPCLLKPCFHVAGKGGGVCQQNLESKKKKP